MLAMTMLVGCYLAPRFWVQSHPTLDTTTPAISLVGPGTAQSQGATAAGTGVNPESPEIRLSGSWLTAGCRRFLNSADPRWCKTPCGTLKRSACRTGCPSLDGRLRGATYGPET